jgi:hypothetical protein
MSGGGNIGSTEKLRRLDNYETMQEEERTSLLSCLERIPLETRALDEVLSYVTPPQDVLSVTRCSKHLCPTLLNPSNVMIWRRARRHCVVPDLPPPLPGWSEPAYAAFIFDLFRMASGSEFGSASVVKSFLSVLQCISSFTTLLTTANKVTMLRSRVVHKTTRNQDHAFSGRDLDI